MRYTRIVSTLAALCVFVGIGAGSARAADQQTTAPPPVKRTGLYGGIGWGVGIHDDPSSTDDAWRLQVWWRPFPVTSLEIGYINAGQPEHGSDIDGLHLAFDPTLPLGPNFDVFGKVGGFFHEDDSNVTVGIGGAWHIWNGFGLRVDWDRLNVDDSDGINVVTASVFYHLAKQGR